MAHMASRAFRPGIMDDLDAFVKILPDRVQDYLNGSPDCADLIEVVLGSRPASPGQIPRRPGTGRRQRGNVR